MLSKLPFLLLKKLRTKRDSEYKVIEGYINEGSRVFDVGCGTGTFIARDKANRKGIDINPENVEYCKERGLNAQVGSAFEIDEADNSWDVVLSNHVFQVFTPAEAVRAITEMVRIAKPNGLVIVSTLNNYKWFYEHPENVRPYLPATFRRYAADRANATSPMWEGMPRFKQEHIWLRREPLVFFGPRTSGNVKVQMFFNLLNDLQYGLYIVKPRKHDAYTIMLRVNK